MVPQTGPAWVEQLTEAMHGFVDYLTTTRDCSPHTLRAYGRDLTAWLAWLAPQLQALESSRCSLGDVCQLIEQYPSSMQGLGSATVARKWSTLRSFFKYAVRHQGPAVGFSGEWLTIRLQTPKARQRLPNFLTAEQCQQLLEAITPLPDEDTLEDSLESSVTTALQARNRAILLTLFTAGLRVGELTGLRWGDLDGEEATLRVLGKGSKERLAFVSPEALAAIAEYKTHWLALLARNRKRFKQPRDCRQREPLPTDSVWLSHTGVALSSRSVGRMLAALAQQTGLVQVVHPHVFRHSFATHLLNNGVELRMVQELLGHASIRSTQIYTHLQTRRLRQAYQSAHPRALASVSSPS